MQAAAAPGLETLRLAPSQAAERSRPTDKDGPVTGDGRNGHLCGSRATAGWSAVGSVSGPSPQRLQPAKTRRNRPFAGRAEPTGSPRQR